MLLSAAKRITLFVSIVSMITACSIRKHTAIVQPALSELLQNKDLSPALVGIALYDMDTKRWLYQYQSDKYFTPASNMKLFTCYAAMKYLGDSIATFKYIVGKDSSLLVQPLADPTFLHPRFQKQPGYSFLKKFKSVRLSYDKDATIQRLGSGWAWDDYVYSYSAQQSLLPIYENLATVTRTSDQTVAIQPSYFKKSMAVKQPFPSGFNISRAWDSNTFSVTGGGMLTKKIPFVPDASTVLYLLADTLRHAVKFDATFFDDRVASTLYTQSTDTMLQEMMQNSDNFLAEQSLLMVGLKQWNTVRTKDIIDTLLKTDFKNLPQAPKWVDGNGLSRYNLCTPQSFVRVLCAMEKEFSWNRITKVLPAGDEGTLAGYYRNYTGHIYAKTGTLSNNASLSGYLITKKGKRLAFSVLVNHHTKMSKQVYNRIENFITQVIEKY